MKGGLLKAVKQFTRNSEIKTRLGPETTNGVVEALSIDHFTGSRRADDPNCMAYCVCWNSV